MRSFNKKAFTDSGHHKGLANAGAADHDQADDQDLMAAAEDGARGRGHDGDNPGRGHDGSNPGVGHGGTNPGRGHDGNNPGRGHDGTNPGLGHQGHDHGDDDDDHDDGNDGDDCDDGDDGNDGNDSDNGDCGCDGFVQAGAPPIDLIGTEGSDTLTGTCADENIVGGAGNDILIGGGGHDGLSGNWGTDFLTGGCGPDTFVFDGNFDTEIVTDFTPDEGDTLRFVIYPSQFTDITAEELLGFAQQVGDNVVFMLPDSDETVILQQTDLADLTADLITVELVPPDDVLIA